MFLLIKIFVFLETIKPVRSSFFTSASESDGASAVISFPASIPRATEYRFAYLNSSNENTVAYVPYLDGTYNESTYKVLRFNSLFCLSVLWRPG